MIGKNKVVQDICDEIHAGTKADIETVHKIYDILIKRVEIVSSEATYNRRDLEQMKSDPGFKDYTQKQSFHNMAKVCLEKFALKYSIPTHEPMFHVDRYELFVLKSIDKGGIHDR